MVADLQYLVDKIWWTRPMGPDLSSKFHYIILPCVALFSHFSKIRLNLTLCVVIVATCVGFLSLVQLSTVQGYIVKPRPRQAKGKRGNRYVIKIMSVKKRGMVSEVHEDQRLFGPFQLGGIKTTLLLI